MSANSFDIQQYCATDDDASMVALASKLEGQWQASYQAGYVVMGEMAMPHPASGKTEHGRLVAREDGLSLLPNGNGPKMTFHWVADETWHLNERPTLPEGTRRAPGLGKLPRPSVDGQELGILAGCSLNDLPRLAGTGSVTRKGTTAEFTLRLMVLNADLVYGFQEVNATARGMHVTERRPFVMKRE